MFSGLHVSHGDSDSSYCCSYMSYAFFPQLSVGFFFSLSLIGFQQFDEEELCILKLCKFPVSLWVS
jgi:hypothetical protein